MPLSDRDLDALQRPLPLWHPKAWYYGAVWLALQTIGRLSHGIRVGHRYGFDSGVMLDHVYSNTARGFTPLGRLIDRIFLDAPGWAGIRNRGKLLQAKLEDTVRLVDITPGQSVRLADLACGGGQYVLDALAQMRHVPVDAVLRDYRPENVDRTQMNADERAVAARIEKADAFSDTDLSALGARDIVIVSGLHEIIPDDDLIRRHFRQIANLVPRNGFLLLTVQPDHPQLELIARTLTSHTGRPWAMRLRGMELTMEWAKAAGFSPVDWEMEETGIFGVIRFRRA